MGDGSGLQRIAERPIGTAIAGTVFIAFSGTLVRFADVSPTTAAVFRCVYALPALALLAAAERRRFGPRPAYGRKLAGIAGVCFAGDLILWHHAINAVGGGLATVLGNLQVVVVGLVAWAVLGERPPRSLFVAVPVVLAGVVLISGVVGGGAYGADPVLGVVFGVGTSLAYAGFILVLRQGSADVRRPAGPLLDATAVAALVCVVAGLVLGDVVLTPTWPAHGWLLTLALSSQVMGWMLISSSLPRLPAAVTSMLLLLQPIGALFLGAVLLAESPSLIQLIGCAVILAGVVVSTVRRPRRAAPHPALATE
ncbi:MAG: DMT family transporter [Euzebyaceae bacterium]|jgi:drug/metabolite transporter (DMT)-like permease|nr:DMT family transporter [Euzebyaceae bacterium]